MKHYSISYQYFILKMALQRACPSYRILRKGRAHICSVTPTTLRYLTEPYILLLDTKLMNCCVRNLRGKYTPHIMHVNLNTEA